MTDYKDIAKKLKNSFSVEGVPLIKSDRFTKEEISQMVKESKAHNSHWLNMMPAAKTWSDNEIETQVKVLMTMPTVSSVKIDFITNTFMKALKYEDIEKEYKLFKEMLFYLMGWNDSEYFNPKFWSRFGSAPYIIHESNKNLVRLQKLYGACGMIDLFGDKFSNNHTIGHDINNKLYNFKAIWKEFKALKDIKETTFSSPYKVLDDIEENVVMKKIPEATRNYYLDKSKPFEERLEVFNKYGAQNGYIFNSTQPDISTIIETYIDREDLDKYQDIEISSIIENWIEILKKKSRNYKLSKESTQRLYKYYMEKVFIEGVCSFKLDW